MGANLQRKRVLRELEERLDKYTKKGEYYELQYQTQ